MSDQGVLPEPAPDHGEAADRSGPDSEPVIVRPLGGERYAVGVAGRMVVVDQPFVGTAETEAVSGAESLVGSIAYGVAAETRRFLEAHDVDLLGVRVLVSFAITDDLPPQVADVVVTVRVPALPEAMRVALRKALSPCTARCPEPVKVSVEVVGRATP